MDSLPPLKVDRKPTWELNQFYSPFIQIKLQATKICPVRIMQLYSTISVKFGFIIRIYIEVTRSQIEQVAEQWLTLPTGEM